MTRFKLEGGGKHVDFDISSYEDMKRFLPFIGALLWDGLFPDQRADREAEMRRRLSSVDDCIVEGPKQ
jgi:hypothetical protein